MSTQIPDEFRALLTGPNFAHLATTMKDGSPQVTPVWVDLEDDLVIINTADGRVKANNMDRTGKVALSVADPENPYRYIQVRGEVAEKTHEDADKHIDEMAKKYMGVDTYPYHDPNVTRVIFKVRPTSVQTYG